MIINIKFHSARHAVAVSKALKLLSGGEG